MTTLSPDRPLHLGVVGGGAWGTALAQVAAAGGPVTLWARSAEVVDAINRDHANPAYLPGVALSPAIVATTDSAALQSCDALLLVTPAQHMRDVMAGLPMGDRPLILCSKGIEAGTQLLMSEVAAECRPDAPIAVLSGPTFAHEVAAGLPTAVTLACEDDALGERLANRIARSSFRPYRSADVVGAEIGGAVKNVLAIACGVVSGHGLGQNAGAALIARGFAEMARFGAAKGATSASLAGLAGLGDLVLTCSSTASRNFSLGVGLGRGERAVDLLAHRRTVAEGAATAPVLVETARALGVEMPIAEAVCALLSGDVAVGAAIEQLLTRPLTPEHRL
ncbi:NAD(P)H-dependent glycerol-3-phosphate dehydrogenase [Sphingomonas abietis]|uniref:Glycerol-3-phosphate dehydrogenase [NAD(P)+] n=1 Tax=Sphingomonas abietis TaxID=3012344 RepID=A0ABY7NLV0_9SPHN|nr:NAD(P)H-dependent glycerol-3-phosphate dehydrogenase [Sphingomonas abietis]WBO22493.1 NAD(P)-dependent glycerol-3-phosphate dehydrogenase [Sphingomonas abietis]